MKKSFLKVNCCFVFSFDFMATTTVNFSNDFEIIKPRTKCHLLYSCVGLSLSDREARQKLIEQILVSPLLFSLSLVLHVNTLQNNESIKIKT